MNAKTLPFLIMLAVLAGFPSTARAGKETLLGQSFDHAGSRQAQRFESSSFQGSYVHRSRTVQRQEVRRTVVLEERVLREQRSRRRDEGRARATMRCKSKTSRAPSRCSRIVANRRDHRSAARQALIINLFARMIPAMFIMARSSTSHRNVPRRPSFVRPLDPPRIGKGYPQGHPQEYGQSHQQGYPQGHPQEYGKEYPQEYRLRTESAFRKPVPYEDEQSQSQHDQQQSPNSDALACLGFPQEDHDKSLPPAPAAFDPGYTTEKPSGPAAFEPGYTTEKPSENLKRCLNLARQAAEKVNGGLGRYRTDRLMHGSPEDLQRSRRLKIHADGSVSIAVHGRPVFGQGDDARLGETLDIRTVVRIGPDRNDVTVLGNDNPHLLTRTCKN